MHRSDQKMAFNYFGSKFTHLKWLYQYIPFQDIYHWVDLFGGSLSVSLNKPQSKIETVNDLDENIINFFLCLRDHPEELIRSLHLTPYSRQEFDEAWELLETDSPVEKARKFFVRQRQSFGSTGSQIQSKGWNYDPHSIHQEYLF